MRELASWVERKKARRDARQSLTLLREIATEVEKGNRPLRHVVQNLVTIAVAIALFGGSWWLFKLGQSPVTSVERFDPWTPIGLSSRYAMPNVDDAPEVECHTASSASEQANAWRCRRVGETPTPQSILDPCFRPALDIAGYSNLMACFEEPWDEEPVLVWYGGGEHLDLSRRHTGLVYSGVHPSNLPWALELQGGRRCSRVINLGHREHDQAYTTIGGLKPSYICDENTLVLGIPQWVSAEQMRVSLWDPEGIESGWFVVSVAWY